MRRFARGVVTLLAIAALAAIAAFAPARHAVLQRAGHALSTSDPPGPADLLTMDVDSGLAGVLEIADLYREQPKAGVALLVPNPTTLDEVARRRGVVVPHVTRDVLQQLGVKRDAILEIPAGEGGTTETTAALAGWARAHPSVRILVVVGPSHGRRYRRALLRAWPEGHDAPRVVTTPYALFRGDDWWQSRTTLREGLVEIEKLALDFAAHPF